MTRISGRHPRRSSASHCWTNPYIQRAKGGIFLPKLAKVQVGGIQIAVKQVFLLQDGVGRAGSRRASSRPDLWIQGWALTTGILPLRLIRRLDVSRLHDLERRRPVRRKEHYSLSTNLSLDGGKSCRVARLSGVGTNRPRQQGFRYLPTSLYL